MTADVIENPIINSPFAEPRRHFKFSDEGITKHIIEERRISSYFVPIPQSRKKGKNPSFDTEWTENRLEENRRVNQIRQSVSNWRKGGYIGVTSTTARLLQYWTNPEREKKLFFCQIEALETAIYITEVAKKYDSWIENELRQDNETFNASLPRIALKMATGAGKTVVMAMIIAWNSLNKINNQQDARFTDAFLIVAPGITIRDRLRVLLPNDLNNYYRERDIIPSDLFAEMGKAKIVITNYHSFQAREKTDVSKLTKAILAKGSQSPFTETPDQMVRRVCRELGNKKNIIVINDEAHHCYQGKPSSEEEPLSGEERKEATKREEQARVWLSGLKAIRDKLGIRKVFDLSATPFFLRGSGYPEGRLFPWVVSDFSLIDAIESGIVKIPRVPVADDSVLGEQPTYRDLWLRIRDNLPKKGRKTEEATGDPKLPAELEGAIQSLYSNYEKYFNLWKNNKEAQARGLTPPVFIVVCNNTNVSNLVYKYISGYEKTLSDGSTVIVPGNLSIFNNEDSGVWRHNPNTILVDSEQLESGDAMSADFKRFVSLQIEEFKTEYRARFPGRDAEKITDEDILREVMNTVGKAGKLGENIKCVVSVSMLTEGWDANTVTHVLGVRAFGTQLLCEQVVGRALRRMSYAVNENGLLSPEYAEVYGVPFSFIPCSGSSAEPKPGPAPTRVRALECRSGCEITFPRLVGYRYEVDSERISYAFNEDSSLTLSTADIPTKTENAPIVGASSIHTLDDLRTRRMNEVAFLLAKLTLEKYFRQDGEERVNKEKIHCFDSEVQAWLFPQVLEIAKKWLSECVVCKDNTFHQLLLLVEFAHDASDRIYKSIVRGSRGSHRLKPILKPYDTFGSTRYVDFDTTKPVYSTDENKCHISHVVADTESWEQKMATVFEELKEVVHYAKNNQSLGLTIPYTLNGEQKLYYPDFIAHIGDGGADYLNLIVEVTGEKQKDKAAKVSSTRDLWIPAVNNHGSLGRWAYIEILDPWNAKNAIREFLQDNFLKN